MTTLQERLRNAPWMDHKSLVREAADRIDDLTAKLDQYRTEYFQALRERDELAADKEVLLGHMATIRNVTNDPAISNLAKVVLERMAPGGGK